MTDFETICSQWKSFADVISRAVESYLDLSKTLWQLCGRITSAAAFDKKYRRILYLSRHARKQRVRKKNLKRILALADLKRGISD